MPAGIPQPCRIELLDPLATGGRVLLSYAEGGSTHAQHLTEQRAQQLSILWPGNGVVTDRTRCPDLWAEIDTGALAFGPPPPSAIADIPVGLSAQIDAARDVNGAGRTARIGDLTVRRGCCHPPGHNSLHCEVCVGIAAIYGREWTIRVLISAGVAPHLAAWFCYLCGDSDCTTDICDCGLLHAIRCRYPDCGQTLTRCGMPDSLLQAAGDHIHYVAECGCWLTREDHRVRCDRCGFCRARHCACFTTAVAPVSRPPRFWPAPGRKQVTNPVPRFLSVEIEVASADTLPDLDGDRSPVNAVADRWGCAIVRDGSLPRTGFEINTAPASGSRFTQQVRELCEALAEQRATVSSRCGLHVHADARDYDVTDLRRLVNLYFACEAGLFLMVPPARRRVRFAAPCARKYKQGLDLDGIPATGEAWTERLQRSVYKNLQMKLYGDDGEDAGREMNRKYAHARYYALNLHSYFFRQTLELRLPPGSVDEAEIRAWAMLFGAIVHAGKTLTDGDVMAMTKEFSCLAGHEGELAPRVMHESPELGEASLHVLRELAPTQAVRVFVDGRFRACSGMAETVPEVAVAAPIAGFTGLTWNYASAARMVPLQPTEPPTSPPSETEPVPTAEGEG